MERTLNMYDSLCKIKSSFDIIGSSLFSDANDQGLKFKIPVYLLKHTLFVATS